MKKWVIWTPLVLVVILLLSIFLYIGYRNVYGLNSGFSWILTLVIFMLTIFVFIIILYIGTRSLRGYSSFSDEKILKKDDFFKKSPLRLYYLEYFPAYLKKFWWLEILVLILVIPIVWIRNFSKLISGIFVLILGLIFLIGTYKKFSYITESPHYKIGVEYDKRTNKKFNRERFIRIVYYISSILFIIIGGILIIFSI